MLSLKADADGVRDISPPYCLFYIIFFAVLRIAITMSFAIAEKMVPAFPKFQPDCQHRLGPDPKSIPKSCPLMHDVDKGRSQRAYMRISAPFLANST